VHHHRYDHQPPIMKFETGNIIPKKFHSARHEFSLSIMIIIVVGGFAL
jgi:hypothetical protein